MSNTYIMGKTTTIGLALGVAGIAMSGSLMAADTLEGALKDSTTKLNLRPRYEKVEQAPFGTSEAMTIKTRLTFSTGRFSDIGAVLEFDDVTSLKSVDYNDGTGNGESNPVIADPEGTEVNQAYLTYTGVSDTDFRWGRQRILLDNQRFIGGVAWRQNEQTYDSFSVGNGSVGNLKLFYAHLSNVNRLFGEQAGDKGDHAQDSHLLNGGYNFDGIGTLSGYYYDIENKTAAALSSTTYGLRFAGNMKFDSFGLGYELEYADQEGANGNPNEYSADYTLIGVSGTMGKFTVGVAQETLGADSELGIGFTTSLGTVHKFQGWADLFLATPDTGVKDQYVTFKAGLPWGMSAIAVYHTFQSVESVAPGLSSDYGTEIDAAITKTWGNGASVQLKYADFSGEDGSIKSTDVEKIWFTVSYAI